MKQIKLTLLLGLLIAFSSSLCAQPGTKVYNYAYSYSYKTKMLYVSDIQNGIINSEVYHDASKNRIHNQWHDYFKTLVTKYYDYTIEEFTWLPDYNKIVKSRNETIGKFKQENFTIKYVKGFQYLKEKLEY